MIVSVNEKWDDPDLGGVSFIDLDKSDLIYVTVIQNAMKNPNKIGNIDCNTYDKISNNIVYVKCPCSVIDNVTIYID